MSLLTEHHSTLNYFVITG